MSIISIDRDEQQLFAALAEVPVESESDDSFDSESPCARPSDSFHDGTVGARFALGGCSTSSLGRASSPCTPSPHRICTFHSRLDRSTRSYILRQPTHTFPPALLHCRLRMSPLIFSPELKDSGRCSHADSVIPPGQDPPRWVSHDWRRS